MQGILAWLCVIIQIYLTYELLIYTTGGAIENLKEEKQLKRTVFSAHSNAMDT